MKRIFIIVKVNLKKKGMKMLLKKKFEKNFILFSWYKLYVCCNF